MDCVTKTYLIYQWRLIHSLLGGLKMPKILKTAATLHGTSKLSVILRTFQKETNVVLEEHEKEYPLRELSIEELFEIRVEHQAGFVLKMNCHYYYTPIPKELKLVSLNILGTHLCANSTNTCQFFSSKPLCDGGCAKVRDAEVRDFLSLGIKQLEVVNLSKRIEKYDFITVGYETFNTDINCFVVVECSNFR